MSKENKNTKESKIFLEMPCKITETEDDIILTLDFGGNAQCSVI